MQLEPADLRSEDLTPKNILMIGPTGVGKTEIARRRLAKLAKAPFIKVEATKFTEVGYVGRDVESIIRDLVDTGDESCCAKQQMTAGAAPVPLKSPPKIAYLDALIAAGPSQYHQWGIPREEPKIDDSPPPGRSSAKNCVKVSWQTIGH